MKMNTMHFASAEQILSEYQEGSSFFMASPTRTLLTKGIVQTVPTTGYRHHPKQLLGQIQTLLQDAKEKGGTHPMVAGAIPFDDMYPARLMVPLEVKWSGPLSFDHMLTKEEQTAVRHYHVTPVPTSHGYKKAVEQGLQKIKDGELQKIVLSRSVHLTSTEKPDVSKLLYKLAIRNPNGYTFAAPLLKGDGSDRTFPATLAQQGTGTLLGASPELLVSTSGSQVIVNPLAGSTPRRDDPQEDRRRADALLISEKNRHEHAIVIEAVTKALKPFCKTLHVPKEPSLLCTETMWHLSTVISGELLSPSISSLELALALHPTPAVCGTPTLLAKQAIQDIEPFERGFFTGTVGWCDIDGDGEWIVTIRCAEVEEQNLRLFAGAGIVEGSVPEEELSETSAKLCTMMRALGLDDDILA